MRKLLSCAFCLIFLLKIEAQNTVTFAPKLKKGNKITIKTHTLLDENAKIGMQAMGITGDTIVTTSIWDITSETADALKVAVKYTLDENTQKMMSFMGAQSGLKLPNFDYSLNKNGTFQKLNNPAQLAADYRTMMSNMFKNMDKLSPDSTKKEEFSEMMSSIGEMMTEMFSDEMLVSSATVEVKNILQFEGETLEKGKNYEKEAAGAAEMMPFGVTGRLKYTLESVDDAKKEAIIVAEQSVNKDSLVAGMMKLMERTLGFAKKMAIKQGKPEVTDAQFKEAMDGMRTTFAEMDMNIKTTYTMNTATGLPSKINQMVVMKGIGGSAGEHVTVKDMFLVVE